MLRQLRELRRFVPAFGNVQLIRVWSGMEGYISDWQPVMGPSARVPGRDPYCSGYYPSVT